MRRATTTGRGRDGGAEMATLDYLGYLQASLAMALTRSS